GLDIRVVPVVGFGTVDFFLPVRVAAVQLVELGPDRGAEQGGVALGLGVGGRGQLRGRRRRRARGRAGRRGRRGARLGLGLGRRRGPAREALGALREALAARARPQGR